MSSGNPQDRKDRKDHGRDDEGGGRSNPANPQENRGAESDAPGNIETGQPGDEGGLNTVNEAIEEGIEESETNRQRD